MFTKTTAIFGLFAASGVMAEYPAYKADNATSMAMSMASQGTAAPAPSPVWQYYNTTVPTTVVVPVLTTVCPEATTLTYNKIPYTVTKGETLVVTDCPCTVTKPVIKITSSLCAAGVTPTAAAPAMTMAPGASYPPQQQASANSPAMIPGSPAAPGYSAPPAGVAPASPVMTTAAASASAVYTSQPGSPSAIQVAGAPAGSSLSGFGVAVLAAFLGALAL